jgi:hypothetical protein
MKCYYHKEFKNEEIETGDQPFCSEEEHEAWASANYGHVAKEYKSWSVEEMVAGLKRMAQEDLYSLG